MDKKASGLKSSVLSNRRWTELEKQTLLKGLKKYGPEDLDSLKTLLPHKSKSCIEQMIRKYQAIAELGKKEMNSPLDIWLRSGIFQKDNFISDALLFISLFEDHPPPEETAGFDLKAAYKFLYDASKGQASNALPAKTAFMFKQLMLSTDKELWPANECSTTDYLIDKLCRKKSDKCYEKKKEATD